MRLFKTPSARVLRWCLDKSGVSAKQIAQRDLAPFGALAKPLDASAAS
jgi:hypothetical protein